MEFDRIGQEIPNEAGKSRIPNLLDPRNYLSIVGGFVFMYGLQESAVRAMDAAKNLPRFPEPLPQPEVLAMLAVACAFSLPSAYVYYRLQNTPR